MTERRGSRSRDNAARSNSRPNSGIFNIMWTKMAEYLEMRTYSDWSSDSDEAEQTTPNIKHENGLHEGLVEPVEDHFNHESNSKTTTNERVNSEADTEHNEVFTGTSSANDSFDYPDSGLDSGKSSTSSTLYSYHSSTVSSNSSFASFRDGGDEDFDFVDTLTFQDYDGEYEQEYADQQRELGEGHSFVPTRLYHLVTWCDKCGEIIWGFHKQCLRCAIMLDFVSKFRSGMHSIKRWMWNFDRMKQEVKLYGQVQYPGQIKRFNPVKSEFIPLEDCKYTCHFKCYQDGVRLDCSENHNRSSDSSLGGYDVSPDFTFVSVKDSTLTSLSRDELLRRTVEYNVEMGKKVFKVEPDEGTSFFGPFTVNFNLSRPVSIKSGSPVPTFCNSLKRYDHSVDVTKRRTSFFFPKAQVESLSITSETSAQEVVDCLLKRYKLIDNPHKFALFEKTEKGDGEVLMRKLEDEDTPLLNVLFWGPNNTEKSMELRENETGIVQWEAFTVPELQNFLRILQKEEEEYIEQVKKKYQDYQTALEESLKDKKMDTEEVEATS